LSHLGPNQIPDFCRNQYIKATQQNVNDSSSENSVKCMTEVTPNPTGIECTGKMNTFMTNTFWFTKHKPNRTLLMKQLQTHELPTTHTNSPQILCN